MHGYAQACLLFLTKAKIPDRVATRNSGAVHGHAYFFALVPYSMHIGIIKTPNFCQLAMMWQCYQLEFDSRLKHKAKKMHSKFSHTMVCTFPAWLASPFPGPQNKASGCKCNIWLNCMISHPEIGNTIWSNYFVKNFSQTCLQKKWAANQDTTSPQKFKWLMAQAETLGLTLLVFSTHQILLLTSWARWQKIVASLCRLTFWP